MNDPWLHFQALYEEQHTSPKSSMEREGLLVWNVTIPALKTKEANPQALRQHGN